MSRAGAKPGDTVWAAGAIGMFWAGIIATRSGRRMNEGDQRLIDQALLRPVPLVVLGHQLRTSGFASACTDSSDGLYAAAAGLCQAGGVGISIDSAHFQYPETVLSVARFAGIDPIRLALGFGDLQLVFTTPEGLRPDVTALAADLGVGLTTLGHVVDQEGIFLAHKGRHGRMANFDNERFSRASQFTVGLESYMDDLMTKPLWATAGNERMH